MAGVGVVTDSTVCLPPELVATLGIETVPLRFFLGDRTYRDGIDITADEIYRWLQQSQVLPTTSAPTPSDYYAAIERVAASHRDVLIITITRRFSAMHQSATTAAETARDTLRDVGISVLDSGTAAGAEGLVVLRAARAAAGGATLAEVSRAAQAVMERVELVAFLDTLYYLARSGRVPMAAHWANSVVKTNPVFRIRPLSGEVKTVAVTRGRESATRRLLHIVEHELAGRALHGVVFHSYRIEEAERLRDRMTASFHCEELYVTDFTPAMGIHTGPGVLGLAYYAAM